jgi:hypothetical protein
MTPWSAFLRTAAIAVAAAIACGASPPSFLQEEEPQVAARGLDSIATFDELDALLIERYAMSAEGRESLEHLLRAHVLDQLARESNLVIADETIEQRLRQLEREVRSAGEADDLSGFLRKNQLSEATFRAFLRRGLVQEELSRQALGIPADRAVPPDQQEMWLDQILEQRGVALPPPPWKDGIAGRCGDLVVSANDYAVHLRTQLSSADVRESCYQLLLVRRMEERMPDLSDSALEVAIAAEVERRRAEVLEDPRYQGATWDQLMVARGTLPDRILSDPALRIGALAELWVERAYGEEGLARVYRNERDWFDGRFGAAVKARNLFVRAAVMTNALNPRSFDQADEMLNGLRADIRSEADFERAAERHSEDPRTRGQGGDLGWITRSDERVPQMVRDVLFERSEKLAAADSKDVAEGERLLGPLRLPTGCVLLWLGERREAPDWAHMSLQVRKELKRRFTEECLPRENVVTFLDAE